MRSQLERIMVRHDLELNLVPFDDPSYSLLIRKALVAGMFMQVAKKKLGLNKNYLTIKDNQEVLIHPLTVLDTLNKHIGEWVLYNEFVLTLKNYIRTVTQIDPQWMVLLAPKYFNLDHFSKGDIKYSLERVWDKYNAKKN